MTPRLVTVAALAVALAPAAHAQSRWPTDKDNNQVTLGISGFVPSCRAAVALLTPDSLGPLRPSQPLEELQRRCPRARYGWEWGDEGIPTPALLLRLGPAVVEVEFPDTLASSPVYRIRTQSPAVKTADGFGPGSLLSAMARAWGPPTFGVGECVLYVWFKSHPGFSFRVRVPDKWQCEDVLAVERGAASKLPSTTTIREVLLVSKEK